MLLPAVLSSSQCVNQKCAFPLVALSISKVIAITNLVIFGCLRSCRDSARSNPASVPLLAVFSCSYLSFFAPPPHRPKHHLTHQYTRFGWDDVFHSHDKHVQYKFFFYPNRCSLHRCPITPPYMLKLEKQLLYIHTLLFVLFNFGSLVHTLV